MSDIKIPLSEPCIGGNEWRYIKDCLDSGWVSSVGKYVDKFEDQLAAYVGTKYAVACVNGTAALHISLLISGVGLHDEVLVPTLTFIAPVNTIKYVGAEPVFMDCDDYLNIDVGKVEQFIKNECVFKKGQLINKRSKRSVKAIIPVHIFGSPVDMNALIGLAKKYNLTIIEDATESLGSFFVNGKFKNKMTGAVGQIGCFSFNGNKIITTGGGGMLVTNDPQLAKKARYLTTQAKDSAIKYIHNEIGYNYRLTNVQAAMGVAQLERLSAYIKIKRKNFKLYEQMLGEIDGLQMINEPDYASSNFWFYSLIIDAKIYGKTNFELMKALNNHGIQARPLWYLNHKQKPYKKNQSYKIEKAEKYYNQVLNLPCSINLSEKDIKRVVGVIQKYAKKQ
ncbi:MAG: LegC family aminotransferase [Candidatus Margulisiibacteriota bacterium]